jgi:hypothetical protein
MGKVDATLRKTEKNGVLQLLEMRAFDPVQFDWSEKVVIERQRTISTAYQVSVLTHRPTGYYMSFGSSYMQWSPGRESKVESYQHLGDGSIKFSCCEMWLLELRKEVDAPDLWGSIAQETALPKAASSSSLDNRPFTAAERSLIAAKLDEIKAFLLEGQQFATEQAETVEREFAYLREASERLGRKDWLNNFLGVMMSLVIGLVLDPGKAKGILHLAGEAFQSLWGMAAGYLQ